MQPEDYPVAEEVVAALSPRRYPFWGWLDLALFIGLFAGVLLLIIGFTALAQGIWPYLKTNDIPLLLPWQLGLYVAIYFPLLVVFRFRYDMPVFSSLGWKRTVSNKTLMVAGLGGLLLSPLIALVALKLHTPEVQMDLILKLQKYPVTLALFGITAVTIGPLFEELLFRGFLQPLFSRTLGVVGGILLTALLFGLLHSLQYKNHWQYVAAVSLVGLVLGMVRYRTGSIIPSTVMHACFNLVASTEIFFPHK